MNHTFKSLKTLAVASMKMYYRNRGAIIFTIIFPLALLAVFGFLSRSNNSSVKVDITNNAHSDISQQLISTLKSISALKINEVSEDTARTDLGKGNTDLQVIIPADFGAVDSKTHALASTKVITHFNEGKPQNGQVANLIIGQVIAGFNSKINNSPQIISVDSSGVKTNNLNFFDFILPGILAMTIMQLGIFGVSFAFVSLKASGALRRIQATPIHPRNFILAQAFTRLIIGLITVGILLSLGVIFFKFHMIGNYFEFTLVLILGILVFLGFGFAIAGYAKDENQVAPLANVIQLPMLLLSGIFFSRDAFPHWLKVVTDYFPLTFLADALRRIANEGVHLTQIPLELLGLGVWGVIIFVVAINVFRWE